METGAKMSERVLFLMKSDGVPLIHRGHKGGSFRSVTNRMLLNDLGLISLEYDIW